MAFPPARFRHHFLTHQQAKLDADAGEADTLPARFAARGDVVIPGQLPAAHPGAIIDRGQGTGRRIAFEGDLRGTRVESIGDDLRENGLLDRSRIGIAQVLQKVQQIDSSFTHLSRSLDLIFVETRPNRYEAFHQPMSGLYGFSGSDLGRLVFRIYANFLERRFCRKRHRHAFSSDLNHGCTLSRNQSVGISCPTPLFLASE